MSLRELGYLEMKGEIQPPEKKQPVRKKKLTTGDVASRTRKGKAKPIAAKGIEDVQADA